MSAADAPPAWRNRIIRSGDAVLADITANPANWRQHPRLQADALAAVIAEVGLVQQVIINQRSGRLVDGHLRVELATAHGESSVPAVWVDLSDDEERLILATLDPLAAMAETNRDALGSLLGDLAERSDALGARLDGLADRNGLGPPFDPEAEWQGMPAFEQEDQTAYRSIIVSFADEDAVQAFARILDQNITNATKSIWHPAQRSQARGTFVSDES